MYYNIKIKSKNSEFTLESDNKLVTQREMDIYFAHIFDVSEEFKSRIKKVEIVYDNVKSIDEIEQLATKETKTEPKNDVIKTQNSQTQKEEFNNSIQFANEKNIETINFKEENINSSIDRELEALMNNSAFNQETPKSELEDYEKAFIELEAQSSKVDYEEISKQLDALEFAGNENSIESIQFTNEPKIEVKSPLDDIQNSAIYKMPEAKDIKDIKITQVEPMIKNEKDYTEYANIIDNQNKLNDFDSLPPDINIPPVEILKFTQAQAEEEAIVRELENFIETNIQTNEPIKENATIEDEKSSAISEKTDQLSIPQEQNESDIDDIVKLAQAELDTIDVSKDSIDKNIIDVLDNETIQEKNQNILNEIFTPKTQIVDSKKEDEIKIQPIEIPQQNIIQKNIMQDDTNELIDTINYIEAQELQDINSNEHNKTIDIAQTIKPIEQPETSSIEIPQSNINNDIERIEITDIEKLEENTPESIYEKELNSQNFNIPSLEPETNTQIDSQNKTQEQIKEQEFEFKTFLRSMKNVATISDEFLICAFFIKNFLTEEKFTMKSINAKLFQATRKIASTTVADELIARGLLSAIEEVDSRKYCITPKGESYFTVTYQG